MNNTEIQKKLEGLRTDIPALFLCFRDAQTPLCAKLLAALTLAYALSPIDLIPDFIPVLGYLDDVIILPALAALSIRLIPKDVWEKNREQAAGLWKDGKPKKWYFALPVLLVWLLILWLIIKAIYF